MRAFNNLRVKLIISKQFLILFILLSSCARPFVRKAPKGEFYLFQNKIVINNPKLSKSEKKALAQKLFLQLEENAKVKTKQKFIFFKMLKHPNVYDSSLSRISCDNISASFPK